MECHKKENEFMGEMIIITKCVQTIKAFCLFTSLSLLTVFFEKELCPVWLESNSGTLVLSRMEGELGKPFEGNLPLCFQDV